MKTRSEIKTELMSALTSPAWSQIKNSLLGNELISLGAEIIYRNQLVEDSFIHSMDYTTASYTDLITLARRNNTCVTNKEPSYIKKYGTSDSTDFDFLTTQIKPYMSKSIGGNTYWTIDYYKKGSLYTLYQGKAYEVNAQGSSFGIFSGPTYKSVEHFTTNIDGVVYYRLSENANPYSVRVYCKNNEGSIWEVPRYNPMLFGTGNEANYNYYKLVTLEDGCLAIVAPYDNSTGMPNFPLQWTCYFVESSYNEFSAEPNDKTIVEIHTGSDDSLDYARNMYGQEIAKYYVISSASDVKAYVTSHDSVLDCQVIPNIDNHSISVYVKPKGSTTLLVEDYSTIMNHLRMYGLFFADYSVHAGTPVKFSFNISNTSGNDSEVTRGEIEDLVLDMYPYETMKFDDPVIATDVSSMVFSKLGLRVDVFLNVSETINAVSSVLETTLIPEQSTVRFINSVDNSVTGWDCNGIIRGKESSTETIDLDFNTANVIGAFGRCLIIRELIPNATTAKYQYWVYDTDTATLIKNDFDTMVSAITGGLAQTNGMKWLNSSTNPMFVTLSSTGDLDTLYILYDTSFWHNPSCASPSAAVLWTKAYDAGIMGAPSAQTYQSYNHFVQEYACIDRTLYHITKESGNLIIYINQEDFSLAPVTVGTLSSELRNVFVLDGNIFIFTNAATCFEIPIALGTYTMRAMSLELPDNGGAPYGTSVDAFFTGTSASMMCPYWYVNTSGTTVKTNALFFIDFKSFDACKVYTNSLLVVKDLNRIASTDGTHFNGSSLINADTDYLCYRTLDSSSSEDSYTVTWISHSNGASSSFSVTGTSKFAPIPCSVPTNIGSIDYEHGIIVLSDSSKLSGTTLTYQSTKSTPQDSMHYFVLNEDKPVIWK